MTLRCGDTTRYIDGLPTNERVTAGDREVRFSRTELTDDEVRIDDLAAGTLVTIAADERYGIPEITRPLGASTKGRKGRKQFAEALESMTDREERGAYLAAALGGMQRKLGGAGKFGSSIVKAVLTEARIPLEGIDLTVDDKWPHAGVRYALAIVADNPRVDTNLRRCATRALRNHPASGALNTPDGVEEAYDVDRVDRDCARIDDAVARATAALAQVRRADGQSLAEIANRSGRHLHHALATEAVRLLESPVGNDLDAVQRHLLDSQLGQDVRLGWDGDMDEALVDQVIDIALTAETEPRIEATKHWLDPSGDNFTWYAGRAGFHESAELAAVVTDRLVPEPTRGRALDMLTAFAGNKGVADLFETREPSGYPTGDVVTDRLDMAIRDGRLATTPRERYGMVSTDRYPWAKVVDDSRRTPA